MTLTIRPAKPVSCGAAMDSRSGPDAERHGVPRREAGRKRRGNQQAAGGPHSRMTVTGRDDLARQTVQLADEPRDEEVLWAIVDGPRRGELADAATAHEIVTVLS
jgi:hypothetical protein